VASRAQLRSATYSSAEGGTRGSKLPLIPVIAGAAGGVLVVAVVIAVVMVVRRSRHATFLCTPHLLAIFFVLLPRMLLATHRYRIPA
jgi:hypothetical protein